MRNPRVYRITGEISIPVDMTIEASSPDEALKQAIAETLEFPMYTTNDSIKIEEIHG